MTPHRTLDNDLPCLRCRYNLRTLCTAARCPECDYPIALTLWGGLPMMDSRRRRRLLGLGCGALAFAIVWFGYVFTKEPGFSRVNYIWIQDPAWVYLPPALLQAAAMVLLSLPQTSPAGLPLFRRTRRAILATAPAGLLSVLLWERAYAWIPARDFPHAKPLLFIPLLAVAPGVLLSYRLLARLVRPLGLARFRNPLRVVTAAWWVITPYVTLPLLGEIPLVGALFVGNWFGRLHLPPPIDDFLNIATLVVGMGLFVLGVAGIPLLFVLAVALWSSQPRNEPLPDTATDAPADSATAQPAPVRP